MNSMPSQRQKIPTNRRPWLCLFWIVLLAAAAQSHAASPLRNREQNRALMVCTFPRDDDCYEEGWPKCCNMAGGGFATCRAIDADHSDAACDKIIVAQEPEPETNLAFIETSPASGLPSSAASATIFCDRRMLLGAMAGLFHQLAPLLWA